MACGGCFSFLRRDGARPEAPPRGARGAVLVLVGMRGAGKSTFSKAAARAAKRQVLDLDRVLEEKVIGCKIREFVDANGWAAFRAKEAELLEDVLIRGAHIADPAAGCVVATGGGVIETASSVELLRRHSPVVWIDRHIDDIMVCLEGDGAYRPGLGEPPRDIYRRRRPLYEACSDFTFSMRRGADNWALLDRRFAHFVEWAEDRARDPANVVIVPIVATSVAAAAADVREAAAEGAGLVELRLDFIAGGPGAAAEGLPSLIAAARRCGLPVLATFRPQWEDKSAGYSGPDAPRFEVLQLAARLGAYYVDVERGAHEAWLAAGGLPAGCRTRLVVSSHDFAKTLPPEELRARFEEMRGLAGPEGVVKLAQMPKTGCEAGRMLTLLAGEGGGTVALAMGETGVFTRVLAPAFPRTRFTFGCLRGRASAPGQLTVLEMVETLGLGSASPGMPVFGMLQPGAFGCRVAGAVTAGLAAAGRGGVCAPIPVRGCSAEELLASLPSGALAKWVVEDEVGDSGAAEQARRLYVHFTGDAAPAPAVLAAMDGAAARAAAA